MRSRSLSLFATLLLAVALMAPVGGAAQPADCHSAHTSPAAAHSGDSPVAHAPATDGRRVSAASRAQLGRVSMANSGAPEAQETFLAGLAALHSFFYDEAADLFREAQEADPDFALAYWGEALTYNHPLWDQQDTEAARAALARLAPTRELRAAKAGTERERAFVETVEVLYGEGDRDERHLAYSEALRELMEAYPDDHEAVSLYALSLQGLQDRTAMDMRMQMESAAILEEVFEENPLHPGAAHYLIHAYDDPVHAPLGLRPARVYAEIAPAAHHALHMPSHIFVQMGMWDEAAHMNERAWQASVDWVERRGHSKTKQDFHSLGWLHYIYLQQGRIADAESTIETALAVAEEEPSEWMSVWMMRGRQVVETAGFRSAGFYPLSTPPSTDGPMGAGAFGRACAAMEGYDGDAPSALFAVGVCALARGDRDAARNASEQLTEKGGGGNRFAKGDVIQARELAALVALAEGDEERGTALLAEAVELEKEQGPPSGPPYPAKPAHELAAEVMLARGEAAEARQHLEAALARSPNRAAGHLAAARAAARDGKVDRAREHYAALVEIWDEADAEVPALAEARSGATGSGEMQAPASR